MNADALNIRRIDTRKEGFDAGMNYLYARLSLQGDVVSEAGRRRTIEVFGKPLSPQQVVERICRDDSPFARETFGAGAGLTINELMYPRAQ